MGWLDKGYWFLLDEFSVAIDSYEGVERLFLCPASLSIRSAKNIRCLIELAQEIKITPRQTTDRATAQI